MKHPIFQTTQHAYQILRMPEDVVCDPHVWRDPFDPKNFMPTEGERK